MPRAFVLVTTRAAILGLLRSTLIIAVHLTDSSAIRDTIAVK